MGLLIIMGVFSSPLVALGVFIHPPLLDKLFSHILELDAIISVVTVTLVETTLFGFVGLSGFFDLIRFSYPNLLEFQINALCQNPLP